MARPRNDGNEGSKPSPYRLLPLGGPALSQAQRIASTSRRPSGPRDRGGVTATVRGYPEGPARVRWPAVGFVTAVNIRKFVHGPALLPLGRARQPQPAGRGVPGGSGWPVNEKGRSWSFGRRALTGRDTETRCPMRTGSCCLSWSSRDLGMGSGERGEAVTTASGGPRPRRKATLGEEWEVAPAELLTPVELADRWGVTTGHLANLRHQGEGIGYLKIGSRVAYRLAEVLDYEDSVYIPARESATRAGV